MSRLIRSVNADSILLRSTGRVVVSGGAFSPTDIANLALWVRSDLGVTKDGSDLVSNWADQSGNGRDLTEATNKPLWVNSLINGSPAIRFDGTNDKLITPDFSLSQPYHFFMVLRVLSAPANERIFQTDNDANTTASAALILNSSGPALSQASIAVSSGNNISIDTTNFHYVGSLFNNTNSSLQMDGGTPVDSTTINPTNFDGVTLGAHGGASLFVNIEVAEFMVYSATISGTDLTDLNSYFSTRYAI